MASDLAFIRTSTICLVWYDKFALVCSYQFTRSRSPYKVSVIFFHWFSLNEHPKTDAYVVNTGLYLKKIPFCNFYIHAILHLLYILLVVNMNQSSLNYLAPLHESSKVCRVPGSNVCCRRTATIPDVGVSTYLVLLIFEHRVVNQRVYATHVPAVEFCCIESTCISIRYYTLGAKPGLPTL